MHLVKPQEHKFAALHGAVWSGGSFCVRAKGRVGYDPASVLFSSQCTGEPDGLNIL